MMSHSSKPGQQEQAKVRTRVLMATGQACLCLLAAAALPGQIKDSWLPISAEELALKDNPASPGAPAIILYRESFTDDVKSFETHYSRIKILTDAGSKYGDVEIPYSEKLVQVEDIRARTVCPDGTILEFQGQIFDKLVIKTRRLKLEAKAFSLPGVAPGSIIEYSYKLQWRRGAPEELKNPQNYIFRTAIAVPSARWTVDHELFTRKAHFAVRPLPKLTPRWSQFLLPESVAPKEQADGTIQMDVQDVPAFPQEEYMPPEDSVKRRVDFFYLLGAWSTDSFWGEYGMRAGEALEKFIGPTKSLERAAAQITAPSDSPEMKLRKLYARVQQIRYLSYEGPRTEKELKRENVGVNKNATDVLNHGYAFANEINLLFIALARAAGFEASLVGVAARDRGIFLSTVPDARQLNAMVVAIRLGSDFVYLDPATRYCPYGLLPWEETGVRGILLNKNRSYLVTTTAPRFDRAITERKARLQLREDGSLEGTLDVAFEGQEALSRRLDANEKDDSGRRKMVEEEVKSWLPAGASVELVNGINWDRSEEPIHMQYRLRIPDFAAATGRRLIFRAAIFQGNRKRPFEHATRKYPVYFRYPYQELDHVTIDVPAGYRVETLPSSQQQSTRLGHFETKAESKSGAVELSRHFGVKQFFVPVEEYGAVRAFFSKVGASDEQKVVLQAIPRN